VPITRPGIVRAIASRKGIAVELVCPTCRQQLSIPGQVPGNLVQCPHCATVLDVSAALQHAHSAPVAQSAGPTGYPSSPGPEFSASAGPAVSTSPRPAIRRRRRNTLAPWLVLGLVILAGGGVVFGGLKLIEQRRQPVIDESQPSRIAFNEAKGHVATHIKAANGYTIADEFRARAPARGHGWVIQGKVHVPTQSGPSVSQDWMAELKQLPDQSWSLVRLEIDRDVVFNSEAPLSFTSTGTDEDGEEIEEFTFVNTNANRPNNDSIFGTAMPMASKDYYEDRTLSWAMGAVADEVNSAVELRKTLVVWLVDQSASAATYRSELQSGLSSIYADQARGGRGADKAASDDAALMSVVGVFGEGLTWSVEEPTANATEIESAVSAITDDASGTENVFAAIKAAAEKYLPYRSEKDRYLMIVVITDEAGDDDNLIEPTLEVLKKNQIPVSIVGSRAPFGRRAVPGVIAETSPDFGQNPAKAGVLMHHGPETPFPENINLAYSSSMYSGDDAELLDSGFGPYSLTRLARETGGTYYACRAPFGGSIQASRNANFNPVYGYMHTFDPQVMRKYEPEYVSPEEFQKLLKENKARQALIDAAKLPRVETMKFARLDFPRLADEAQGKRALDEAQKAAANIEPRIEALYQALKPGEADRNKLTGDKDKRWQAGYDLAMGRVLAAKVRTEGYNAMLAQVKGGFNYKDPESDSMRLTPAEKISAGSAFDRMLKDSRKYLERVVAEHPDTPWAFLAERELKTPIGWEWVESKGGVVMSAQP
jgi:hypothetical protein